MIDDNPSGSPGTHDPSHQPPCPNQSPIAAFLAAAQSVPPSSSLDSKESTVGRSWETILRESIGPQSISGKFTHSGWSATRDRVTAGLFRTRQKESRIRAFMQCGNATWIERAKECESRYRLRTNCCHDRLCQVCGGCRSRKITAILQSMMEGKRCRFITLTLCGTRKDKLVDLVDKLMRSFRYLRDHPVWIKGVDGGCAFLEIKRSEKADRWHPHLHIIAEGRFMAQHELSDAWRSITKDSYIVDISDASSSKVHHYVAKYASKPLNSSFSHNAQHLDEAIESLAGRRLVTCFGTWYGTPISSAEDEELADDEIDAAGYHLFMGLEELFDQCMAGHADSMSLMRSIPGGFERFIFYQSNR
jgi:hypothetical protein